MQTVTAQQARTGSLAIFFSASAWGLFWLPMRYFDDSGLTALWAVAAINIAASIIAVPIALWKREITSENFRWLAIIGAGMGISNVLYFSGLILSDVIRVTFLFYLMPIWATLFSKLIFNVTIGPIRMIAVSLAFFGIWLLLGDGGLPIPQNLGDVFGLLSGLGWAFGLTMIRGKVDTGGFGTAAMVCSFAVFIAIALGLVLHNTVPEVQPALPPLETIYPIILPVLAFGSLIMWPTLVGQTWGSQFVMSTTAAILTMSEIMVATLSSTFLEGNNMSLLAWMGGACIVAAIFVDLFASKDA